MAKKKNETLELKQPEVADKKPIELPIPIRQVVVSLMPDESLNVTLATNGMTRFEAISMLAKAAEGLRGPM